MTLDTLIICVYFGLILGVGLWVGRGVKSLDDYSTGGRSYNAFFVFATLSASFIGGGFTTGLAEKSFTYGLIYVLAMWGFSIKEVLIALFIAPRMTQFKNAMSVGDIMGRLYGDRAQIFTGVASVLVCAGVTGAQFAAFGYVLEVMLNIPAFWGSVIGATIVIIYATTGGMKSVVANDMLNFAILAVMLPTVMILGLSTVGGIDVLMTQTVEFHAPPFGMLSALTVFGLFLNFFFGETLVPPYVQRLLIGKTLKQTARGTFWSGLLSFPFFFMVGVIGLIALNLNPDGNPNLSLPYVVSTVMPVGLKGLAIAGMMAVIMSSSDSFLNAAAIATTHDILSPLRSEKYSQSQELRVARIATAIGGVLGLIFSLSIDSAIDILLYAYNFWTPFILVPLVAGIFGARASSQTFWISSAVGIGTVLIWEAFVDTPGGMDGAVMGIFANLIAFTVLTQRSRQVLKAG